MNDVITLLQNHVSVRDFNKQEVDDNLLAAIIQAGQHASTSSHIQAYTIIHIKDRQKKKLLAKLSGEQKYVEECPVFLVFCADLHRLDQACRMNNTNFVGNSMETFILATVDTCLAAQNIMTAAESAGLGGVYIGGVRNNPQDICDLLHIPQNVYPVFGMCLGHPALKNALKPRLPLSLIFKEDVYSGTDDEETLTAYDTTVSNYYIERTGGKRSDTWTAGVAALLKEKQRPHMRDFLQNQGFEMK